MITIMNPRLIEQQKISDEDIIELERLHSVREELFDIASDCDLDDPASVATLRTMADLLECLEYSMQRVWKFPQDSNFHTWWIIIPHCVCPRMDNRDNFGTKYRVISGECPVHNRGQIPVHNKKD